MYNFMQHVSEPTNSFNNILDLVITSNCFSSAKYSIPIVHNMSVSNVYLSNYFLVAYKVAFSAPSIKNKTVYYREYTI